MSLWKTRAVRRTLRWHDVKSLAFFHWTLREHIFLNLGITPLNNNYYIASPFLLAKYLITPRYVYVWVMHNYMQSVKRNIYPHLWNDFYDTHAFLPIQKSNCEWCLWASKTLPHKRSGRPWWWFSRSVHSCLTHGRLERTDMRVDRRTRSAWRQSPEEERALVVSNTGLRGAHRMPRNSTTGKSRLGSGKPTGNCYQPSLSKWQVGNIRETK